MTPLIDLDLIHILYDEARLNKSTAVRQCLNYPPFKLEQTDTPKRMSDAVYAHLMKTYVQAKVIYKNLRRIHKVSSDFSAGTFQPYIDKQTNYEEKHVPNLEERGHYDPFSELDVPFNHAFNFPLPRRIEQFTELVGLCQNFSKVRTLKREGLNPFFGEEPMWYEYTNENGEPVILPPSMLPAEFITAQKESMDHQNARVEGALDNYNEFYFLVMDYLGSYAEGNELVELGTKIRALFK